MDYQRILPYPWFERVLEAASGAVAAAQVPLDHALGIARLVDGRLVGHVPERVETLVAFGCGYAVYHSQIDERLDFVLRLLREQPRCVVVLAGSDRPAEGHEETGYMEHYLLERGVPGHQLVRDGGAHSTELAVRHIAAALGGAPAMMVTSAYHVRRCTVLARRLGVDAYGYLPPDGGRPMSARYRLRDQLALYPCDRRIRRAAGLLR